MSAIGIIATLTVAEGKNAEFEAGFAELAAAVRANEPGNEFYAIFRSKSDPQQYKVLERYVDQAALDAHGKSDHYRASALKLAPCMAAAPEVEYLDGC
jgi:quinol monooxygenase YgiN